jgi:hypothetical protein
MFRQFGGARLCAAALVCLATGALQAATQGMATGPEVSGFSLGATPTTDLQDSANLYLGDSAQGSVHPQDLGKLTPDLSVIAPSPDALAGRMANSPFILQAPLALSSASVPGSASPAASWQPPVQLASFVYPEVTGLAGPGADERAVPLGSLNVLGLGPGGFTRIMTGRPSTAMGNWTDAGETSISYIRPHVNVEMMLSLELPGGNRPAEFEGPGFEPHAYLDIDHQTRVNSADIGASTSQFGGHPTSPPVDEPQTAVSVGLDLGLLPTFLAQMGMSLSGVVSHGQDTGDTRVALVGTTELPVDWIPREQPVQHPAGLAMYPIYGVGNQAVAYGTSIGSSHPPVPPGTPPMTPIVPVVPEPATLMLLACGAATILARRKARRG